MADVDVKIHTLLWGGDALTDLREQIIAGYTDANNEFSKNQKRILLLEPDSPSDDMKEEEWFEDKMNTIRKEENAKHQIIILAGEHMVSLCSEYLSKQETGVLDELHSKDIVFVYVCAHSIPLDKNLSEEKKKLLSKLLFLFWAPRTVDTVHLVAWFMVRKRHLRRIVVLHDGSDYAKNAESYFTSHCSFLNAKTDSCCFSEEMNTDESEKVLRKINDKSGIYIIGYRPGFYEKVENLLKQCHYSEENVWVSDCAVYDNCFKRTDSIFRRFRYIDCCRAFDLIQWNIPDTYDVSEMFYGLNASSIILDLYRFVGNIFEKNNYFDDNDSAECAADALSRDHYFIDRLGNALYVAPHGIPMYPMYVCKNGVKEEEKERKGEIGEKKEHEGIQLPNSANMGIDEATYPLQLVNAYAADFKNMKMINENLNRGSHDKVIYDLVEKIEKIGEKLKEHFDLYALQLISSDDKLSKFLIKNKYKNKCKNTIIRFSATSILNACCSFSSSLQINIDEDDYEDNGAGRFYVNTEIKGESRFHPLLFAGYRCWEEDLYVSTSLDELEYEKQYSSDSRSRIHLIPPDQRNDVYDEINQIRSYFRRLRRSAKVEVHYCYIFPTLNADPRKWFGGLVIFARKKLSYPSLLLLSNVANRLFDPLFYVIHDYQLNFASTRSAIGSIMSRNGSHNIGSHVLSAMSHNVGTMPDDRILYQYIQHRMDYVAQVTTEFPSWAQPTMFVGDIMKGFFSQHHLLEHISQSEGLQAYHFQDHNMDATMRGDQKNRIKLIVRRTSSKWDPKKEDTREVECSFIDADKPIPLDKDVALAIPGGVVGKHAFYTILENIIRNAAKHGWSAASCRRESDNLEIYIDFYDNPNPDKDDIQFTIWDNMSDVFHAWKKNSPGTSDGENGMKAFCWDHSKIIPVVAHAFIQHPAELRLLQNTQSEDGNRKRKKYATIEMEDISKYLPDLLRHERDYLKACIKTAPKRRKATDNEVLTKSDELNRIESDCISLLERMRYTPVQNQEEVNDEQNMDSALDTLIRKDYNHPLSTPRIKYFRDLMEDNGAFTGTVSPNRELIQYFEKLAEAFKDRPEDKETNNQKESMHDLVLPLHWKQLLSLATPMIDCRTGTLRRENWGLAEMKISAGYLQRRTIDEIGGLDESCNYYGNAFLYPTTCPRGKHKHGNREDNCECYHLGYRFAIPKPREILIIVSNMGQKEEEFSEEKKQWYNTLHQYGIYIKSIADAKRNAERDPRFFAYEFVVFPSLECATDLVPDSIVPETHKDKQERIRFANYPFRLLVNDEKGEPNLPEIFSCIKLSSDLLSGPDPDHRDRIVKEIQRIVLSGWRKHWINLRYGRNVQSLKLTVNPYESESKTTGEGLISDADLFSWIFQECFHSSVKSFLSQNKDDLPEDHRVALSVLASMKRRDIMQPKEFNDLKAPGNRHESWVIAQLRKWIEVFCAQYNQLKETGNGTSSCSNIIDEAQWDECNPSEECPCLEDQFSAIEKYKGMLNEHSPELKEKPTMAQRLSRASQKHTLNRCFIRFLDHLDGVFSLEKMQKKAENPVTLPQGFESSAGGKGELTCLITPNGDLDNTEEKSACHIIEYTRHFDRENGYSQIKESEYNESLSGSQTYLYELMDLVKSMAGGDKSIKDFIKVELTITKLVENALARILIIDERVCEFFQAHPKIQRAFSAMNIWVCDTAINTPPHAADDGYYLHTTPNAERTGKKLLTPEFQRSNDITTGNKNKFDILIIHQGLIDKWLPVNRKNEAGIRTFIESLKKVIPYVVLTTGRGRPANTPDEVRVIPYSVVASSLLKQYPEKMILINSIMNVLPVGKKQ